MATDDLELTPREMRAVAALRRTLDAAAAADPFRLDVPAWVDGSRTRRPGTMRSRIVFAVAVAGVVAVVGAALLLPRFGGPNSGSGSSPFTAAPSLMSSPLLPGTAGHFDNGSFSFDYPPGWSILSGAFLEGIAVETYAVLGTGEWHSGCVFSANGGSCNGDTADVSGGRVVVKIWNVVTGPMNMCDRGDDTANETLGPNAVVRSTKGSATTWEIRMPSIIRMLYYIKRPMQKVALTKKNVLLRDDYTCQYCGVRGERMMTVDHVVPRSRAGPSTWENLVCACMRCNNRKNNRSPQDANMKLQRRPKTPKYIPWIQIRRNTFPDEWHKFLFLYNVSIETKLETT